MPELVVAETTAARLRVLAAEHVLPEPLSTHVVRGVRGTLDGASVADISVPRTAPVRLPHVVLADVAAWARDARPDNESLMLVRLLQGSTLYHPPPPVYERPRELDESLEAIRRAQEQQEYERMTSTEKPGPAAPYAVRAAGTARPTGKHALLEERRAWRETRSQLSATANIMLSMVAVAVAAWWSGGTADATWKTLVALALAAVMGIAEYALYARYWRITEQRRQRRQAKH